MKKSMMFLAIVAIVSSSGGAMAADMPDLAKKNNCTACHAVDKKVVGPSFKDVAAKYKGDAGAKAKLATKIIKGGGGVWGAMPMPGSPKISDADASTIAEAILAM